MTDATQPRMGRGTMLPVAILAAALFALLAFAPFASAASDPIGSGSATVTLNKGFFKKLKKNDVKVLKISPATVNKRKVTMTVTGGSLDPITDVGTVTLGGGIKFKAGKRTAPVKALSLDTSKKSLSGKVAGKKMKFASLAGLSFAREGFGTVVSVTKLKLTKGAANRLNKKLGFTGKSSKKHKRATTSSKDSNAVFKANQVLGSSSTNAQPTEVAVLPANNATLALSTAALKKLKLVGPEFPPTTGEHPFEVKLTPVDPTKVVSLTPVTVAFPISGGTIAPTATAGTVQTSGGLKLTQNLEALGPNGKGETTLTMGNVWIDLAAKTASVEVTIENPKTAEANLGNLGRASIADISLTGATIVSNPTARTVSVQNASATLQAVTAETLNSVFITPIEKATGEPQTKFAGGDPLGTFSFVAQTQ